MKDAFLSDKNFKDLDLDFIFERLQVVTPYGQTIKKAQKPLGRDQWAMLEHRFNLLDAMMERFENHRYDVLELKATFKDIKQLSGTFDRLEAGETLSVTELFEMKHLALAMKRIGKAMDKLAWERTIVSHELKPVTPILELLDPEGSGVSNFYIYSSYSQALYDIRLNMTVLEKKMKTHMNEAVEALGKVGIKATGNGEVRIRQNDHEHMKLAKESSLLYYRTDIPMYSLFKVKDDAHIAYEMDQLKIKEEAEEYEVRKHLSSVLKTLLPLLRHNTQCIGEIDLLIAKAQFASAFHCVRPSFTRDDRLHIKGGRHLKVASGLEKEGKKFTPLDIDISANVSLVTGANMGGKTVTLRTIGQIVALAHYGYFVPCESAAIQPVDFIFVSVGDSQSVDMGLSTFGAEILEVGEMLTRISEKGLLLIDELARGTNPREGYAISKALIEHLQVGKSKAIITTHYDGLTQTKGTAHYQVNGLSNIDFEAIRHQIKEKGMALLHEYMDYRLTKVDQEKAIPKEALRISEMMGLSAHIIERAKEILGGSHDE